MKKKSPRTERRERQRVAVKLAKASERLASLEPGGAPSRPIDVESASQVEVHARSIPCARCGGALAVTEHAAVVVEGARLRVVRMSCPSCGAQRALYFRLRVVN